MTVWLSADKIHMFTMFQHYKQYHLDYLSQIQIVSSSEAVLALLSDLSLSEKQGLRIWDCELSAIISVLLVVTDLSKV